MWLSISEVSQFGLSDLLTWPRSLLFLCPELVATSRRVVKMLDVLLNATGLQCYVANCKKWLGFYRQRLSNGSNLVKIGSALYNINCSAYVLFSGPAVKQSAESAWSAY